MNDIPDGIKKVSLNPFTLALLLTLLQCTSKDPDFQNRNCDCQRSAEKKEQKNVEAVMILIPANQPEGYLAEDQYILSTDPADFESTSHGIGKNILVPCNSVPEQYRKAGSRVIVSYKRKNCYGAITLPQLRSNFGYFIDLTSIRLKP